MKITAVRVLRLAGTMRTDGPLWEERLVRPIDIYPEYRIRNDFEGGSRPIPIISASNSTSSGSRPMTAHRHRRPDARHGCRLRGEASAPDHSRPGSDRAEKLWDQMHRIMVHGRQGDAMLAISAVDCALWDLKGRWLGQPVYRLIGGPTATACRPMPRCSASRCSTWAACASVPRNTRRSAIPRRNGSSATVR